MSGRGNIRRLGVRVVTTLIEVGRGRRIEIGCGDRRPKIGFRGADIRDCEYVDYVTEAWNLHKLIHHSSITEVRGRHFFEHLSFSQCEATLRSIHAILAPGAKLQLEVPDLVYHAEQLLAVDRLQEPSDIKQSWTNEQHMLAGFYGWQREGFEEAWDIHKSGFTEDLLRRLLEHHGFINVVREPSEPWNLDMSCVKDASRPEPGADFFSEFVAH